jgi:hypothetical protein
MPNDEWNYYWTVTAVEKAKSVQLPLKTKRGEPVKDIANTKSWFDQMGITFTVDPTGKGLQIAGCPQDRYRGISVLLLMLRMKMEWVGYQISERMMMKHIRCLIA